MSRKFATFSLGVPITGLLEFMQRAGRVEVNWAEVIPERKPVLHRLVVDDESRLWVRRAMTDGSVFDVFDPTGRFLGTVRLQFAVAAFLPSVIRRGAFYAMQRDSLDVQYVVRAKVPSME